MSYAKAFIGRKQQLLKFYIIFEICLHVPIFAHFVFINYENFFLNIVKKTMFAFIFALSYRKVYSFYEKHNCYNFT